MNRLLSLSILSTGLFLLISCGNDPEVQPDDIIIDDADFVASDWTEETHGKSAYPNFEQVFNDNEVKRIDLVIRTDRWDSMLSNLEDLYGTFGSGGQGGGEFADENPIFVPADITYQDKESYRVGVRFKGNSSLKSSWRQGIMKLSFKLDFDEFEDEYPQIDDQRFYGFKQLSLKNNYGDNSMMRERVASDVFRNYNMVVSHTAFYTVYVDYGEGPTYFGLYTLVEEVDDTVIETQFSDDNGNLYKPDGDAASFAAGTFNEGEFDKQTNEDEADYSDVKLLLDILHDSKRTTNPEDWRLELETVLDVDVFLKYLAVNTVIQNWDTYGRMTHNYFLYNNPDNNKLTWIPWDNNEALQYGKMGGSLPLNFSGLNSSEWPLIGYLYQDSYYRGLYDAYVKEVSEGPFSVAAMQSIYSNYSSMIRPYATTETSGYSFLNSSTEFESAVDALNSHVVSRTSAVSSYLD